MKLIDNKRKDFHATNIIRYKKNLMGKHARHFQF